MPLFLWRGTCYNVHNTKKELMPMDSVSHTTVAHYLLDYVETTNGVSFNRKAFMFGNLKPDLKGEYLTKRHYPSLKYSRFYRTRSTERKQRPEDQRGSGRYLSLHYGFLQLPAQ